MPVKGTKALEALKKSTVISTYVAGVLVAPATGHLSAYVDINAADQHRQLEVAERLRNLIDRAREENYLRPVETTKYYHMLLGGAKSSILSTTDPLTIPAVAYTPVDGTVIAFDDGIKNYEPVDGTVIAFVSGGDAETDDTITDSDSLFLTNGFATGQSIIITGSTSNDGEYVIVAVVAGTITLAPESLAGSEAGINGVDFTANTPALITDSDSLFLTEGFEVGQTVTVADSTSNDGEYVIVAVVAETITLAVGALTASEAGINGIDLIGVTGYVAIGINTTVLAGNRGSLLLDACWKEIIDWLNEQDRLTV